MAAKTTEAEKPKKEKPVLQYYHDGMPISEYQNKLSSIAFWYTKGIEGATKNSAGHESMKAKPFVALLHALGVENPRTEAFSVELPNGIVISATVQKDGKLVPIVPRSERPKVDSSAAKKERAELTSASMAEGKLVAEWKQGGEVGDKPATPATDKLAKLLKRRPTKGSQKAAAAPSVKATNVGKGAKKVPAKKAPAKKATAAKKAPASKKAQAGAKPFAGAFPKKAAASKKTA